MSWQREYPVKVSPTCQAFHIDYHEGSFLWTDEAWEWLRRDDDIKMSGMRVMMTKDAQYTDEVDHIEVRFTCPTEAALFKLTWG